MRPARHLVQGPDESWAHQGLCVGQDPEIWFPKNEADEPVAVRVCVRCPVKRECAEYALRIKEAHGVWGGLTEQDRRRILRRRGAA